jgi:hypothetical protein
MTQKKHKQTPQEAGAQNLQKWLDEHPERGDYKHGGYSYHIRRRYSDGRYKQAKELNGIIMRLTRDAGGDENLSEGQRLILGVIRSKFIVAKQISEYVTKQGEIVNGEGEILPCLRSFVTFTEAMRRCIESFYSMANKKPSKLPTIEDLIQQGEKS